MLDMRGFTKHLIQAISGRTAKVSEMQRVFYEVSALLPAMASIIENTDGAVTEYLGDGLLALFQFPFDDKDKREKVCKVSMTVARDCLEALNTAVNPILFARYSLPSLKIGIGMSFSQAIITHFGISPNTQVKVIGRCIYDVSKLSKGENEIVIHENLKNIYPSSSGGKLSFSLKYFGDVKGYVLNRS
jgi:class 3 adenylate cyclase